MHTPNSKSYCTVGDQQTASRSTSGFVLSLPQKTTPAHKERNVKICQGQTAPGILNEQRWSSNLSDLEACFAQLQEELKITKRHGSSPVFQKRQALVEVEEGNMQIPVSSAKLKEANAPWCEMSSSEDDRIQELCKLYQERDKAWALELAAVRQHHSLDIAALTSAKFEIHKLKKQLEMLTESEAVQTKRSEFAEEEVPKLQSEIRETLTLVERLKAEARHCGVKTVSLSTSTSHEVFDSSSVEMKQSVDRAEHEEDADQLKNNIRHLKSQLSELRAASDASEERYREEYLRSTLQIRDAYERAGVAKSESRSREAVLVAELKRLKIDIEELQASQKHKNEKAHSSDEENVLGVELKQARASLADTTASLLEKGKLLQAIAEENEKMKLGLQKAETEKNRAVKRASALAEARKIADSKVVYLTQEADRNSRRVARLTEQLEAAQAANKETEMELRRQKVQCDQWKKAAETAAAMLTRDSDKQLSEKNESVCNIHLTSDSHLSSASCSDGEDDTSKKKKGSMLQKMGVLWKKSNSMKLK